MIVCICRRVSDRDIQRAVREGITDFEVLQDETGVSSHCGACLDCAQEVFDDARAACGGTCPQFAAQPAAGTKTIPLVPSFA